MRGSYSYPTRISAFAIALIVGASPLPLWGQIEGRVLSNRQYCAKQEMILNAQAAGLEYRRAITNIQSCPASAARALISQWNRKHTDRTALEVLGHISPLIRDQGLLEAAIRVAADETRARDDRLSAFSALAGYYDPTVSISYTDRLNQPGLTGFAYIRFGYITPSVLEGTTPLRSDTRSRVLQFFAQSAHNDPDSTIRSIALFLSEVLPRIN